MFNITTKKSLTEGTYVTKLVDYYWCKSRDAGMDGVSLEFSIELPEESRRNVQTRIFGEWACQSFAEGLCDSFDAEFPTFDDLLSHWKQQPAVLTLKFEDGYANWRSK